MKEQGRDAQPKCSMDLDFVVPEQREGGTRAYQNEVGLTCLLSSQTCDGGDGLQLAALWCLEGSSMIPRPTPKLSSWGLSRGASYRSGGCIHWRAEM